LLLLKRGKLIVSSAGFELVIYNVTSKRMLGTLSGHTQKVVCVNWENPSLLYTGSRDKTVRLWDVRNMTCARVFNFDGRIFSINTVSSDPYQLIVGHDAGYVSQYDIRQPAQPLKKNKGEH